MENSGAGIGIVGLIVYLAVLVFFLACGWKIFVKMGQPGWAVLVPFYNYYVLTQALNKPILWFVLMLIPGVNSIVGLILGWETIKAFGKGAGFFVATLFFGFITIPMLAFGSATFTPPAAPATAAA
ncbi:MAG: signal peptidase I [Deltaproteobacteria bacterium]|nr:signal peptidase I [Deltaproteobacteria bacterium]